MFLIYYAVLGALGIVAGAFGARRYEEEMVYTVLLTFVGFCLTPPTGWLWYDYAGAGFFFALCFVLSAWMIPAPVTKTKDTQSPKVKTPNSNSSHSYGEDFNPV